VNSIKLNETLKSDRQGLNEIPATDFNYTDDYPLPEYKPHSSSAVDDSINTVNIDTLNDVPSTIDYEDDYVNEESPASLLPTTIFNDAFSSLPFPQKAIATTGNGYDFTSIPVLVTAFAAAFLGSLVAPLLGGGVNNMLRVDEVQLPGIGNIGTNNLRMEVPRFLWDSSV